MKELDGFPIVCKGTKKFEGADMRVRAGDLVLLDPNSYTVNDVECLAQHLETAVCSELPHLQHKKANTPEKINQRLKENIVENELSEYFESIVSAYFDEDLVEIEFAATGYPGTYVRKFLLHGPFGQFDFVRMPKQRILEIKNIDDELIQYFTENPNQLFDLHPRKFEELVAELITKMGYEVTLTPYSKDEGVDIFALNRLALQTTLTVIDCKRYNPDKPIGPDLIRTIAGLRDQHDANTGMIVTTSYFSKGAHDLQVEKWPYQVSLADKDKLKLWLNQFGWEQSQNGLYLPE